MERLAVVLLAAGHGTRMKSKRQKVLHWVGGKPMVQHVFDAACAVSDLPPVVVVGRGEAGVPQLLGDQARYVEQAERLGTGHAALMAAPLLTGRAAQVIVTYGDMPLLRPETMRRLAQAQADNGATIALLSVLGDTNSSFGRVRRDAPGRVVEIVEVAEARRRPNSTHLLAIPELNVGVYCFDAAWLWQQLPHLPLRQARGNPEYYLTDLIEMAVAQSRPVIAILTDDPDEALGAGTRAEMVAVEKAIRRRTNNHWLNHGVTLIDPNTTYIDPDVTIGQDTVIWPNTYLQGHTTIGQDCHLGPNTILRSAHIGHNCRIEQAIIENSTIADNQTVPPFTHLSGDG